MFAFCVFVFVFPVRSSQEAFRFLERYDVAYCNLNNRGRRRKLDSFSKEDEGESCEVFVVVDSNWLLIFCEKEKKKKKKGKIPTMCRCSRFTLKAKALLMMACLLASTTTNGKKHKFPVTVPIRLIPSCNRYIVKWYIVVRKAQ